MLMNLNLERLLVVQAKKVQSKPNGAEKEEQKTLPICNKEVIIQLKRIKMWLKVVFKPSLMRLKQQISQLSLPLCQLSQIFRICQV